MNLTHRGRSNRSRDTSQTDGSNNSSKVQTQQRTETDASDLKLTVRTAEGDTVELSIASQTVDVVSRGSANSSSNGSQRALAQQSEAKGQALQASIKVTGDLSDAEVQDISDLLSSIGSSLGLDASASNVSAGAATAAATGSQASSTLAAYSYSYSHVHEVTQSAAVAYA